MREYESVFVIHPKVDEAGIDREIETTKETIAAGGGEVVGVHKWGRRKLAYSIQKVKDGYYVIMRFNGEAEILPTLDRKFKLNESILRHLTVVSPGGQWPPELKGRERRGPRRDGPGGPPRGRRFEDDVVKPSVATPPSAPAPAAPAPAAVAEAAPEVSEAPVETKPEA